MKSQRVLLWFLITLIIIVSSGVFASNTTQTTDTRFLFYTNGGERSSLNLSEIKLGTKQYFSGKIINNSLNTAYVYLGFVDGDDDGNGNFVGCKNEGEIEKFGKYVKLTSISGYNAGDQIEIPGNSEMDLNFEFRYPGATELSGKVFGCITHYATGVSDSGCDFSLLTRKANYIEFVVSGSRDFEAPYIKYVNFEHGAENMNLGELRLGDSIMIEFSEDMDRSTVTQSVIPPNIMGLFTLDWKDESHFQMHLSAGNFEEGKSYTIKIGTGAMDLAGNNLSSPVSISFSIEKKVEAQTGSQGGNSGGGNGGGGGGGGGGYSKPEMDNCPDGDYSDSYYDGDCGEYKEVEEDNHSSAGEEQRKCSIVDSEYSDELNQAYIYACNIGITTMPTIQQADMMGPLLRKHLAKMISEFAVKVLGINPNVKKECVFNDMDGETQEMKYFAQVSCQLGLMGLHSDGVTVKDNFDPNDPVTRAQFGTVLSRLLWGTAYATDDASHYWVNHLEALKNNGIMTQIYGDWPNNIELRGWVMLMLMRVNENNLVQHSSASTELDPASQGSLALLDDGSVNVQIENFGDGIMYSSLDFIPIRGEINTNQFVDSIYVSHWDSKGKGVYYDYKLSKFKPGDKDFVFYAYRYYNSLTVNDKNTYEFKFFDKNGKLMFKKTVIINQSYSKNWK